jgi:hypothetical protein
MFLRVRDEIAEEHGVSTRSFTPSTNSHSLTHLSLLPPPTFQVLPSKEKDSKTTMSSASSVRGMAAAIRRATGTLDAPHVGFE